MESDDRASGGCGVDSFLLSQQGKKSRFKVLPCTATLRNRMPVFCRSATTPRAPARRPGASRRTTSKPTSDDGYVTDTALNDDIRHDTSIFNAVPENGEPGNAALERRDSGRVPTDPGVVPTGSRPLSDFPRRRPDGSRLFPATSDAPSVPHGLRQAPSGPDGCGGSGVFPADTPVPRPFSGK